MVQLRGSSRLGCRASSIRSATRIGKRCDRRVLIEGGARAVQPRVHSWMYKVFERAAASTREAAKVACRQWHAEYFEFKLRVRSMGREDLSNSPAPRVTRPAPRPAATLAGIVVIVIVAVGLLALWTEPRWSSPEERGERNWASGSAPVSASSAPGPAASSPGAATFHQPVEDHVARAQGNTSRTPQVQINTSPDARLLEKGVAPSVIGQLVNAPLEDLSFVTQSEYWNPSARTFTSDELRRLREIIESGRTRYDGALSAYVMIRTAAMEKLIEEGRVRRIADNEPFSLMVDSRDKFRIQHTQGRNNYLLEFNRSEHAETFMHREAAGAELERLHDTVWAMASSGLDILNDSSRR